MGRGRTTNACPRRGCAPGRGAAEQVRRGGVGVALTRRPIARGTVYLVGLDPTLGSQIQRTRPCVVVSPDELNEHLRTVIVAPMTTGGRAYPWRPRCRFQARAGFVALDQLRAVDVERLVKLLGQLEAPTVFSVLEGVQDMFAA